VLAIRRRPHPRAAGPSLGRRSGRDLLQQRRQMWPCECRAARAAVRRRRARSVRQLVAWGIALVPALYDGPRIAKVRIPDFDATLRGPHRGRDIAGLHPFNGQDVAVEVEGACSTGCPAWTHASIPPRSGRIFLNPACFRCLAATAADSSFGHAQYTTISSSRE